MPCAKTNAHTNTSTRNWSATSARFLISELSGKSNILAELEKAKITEDWKLARKILERVQELENQGYQFEAADASFDLLIRKIMGTYKPAFELIRYATKVEKRNSGELITEATVKLKVGDKIEHVVGEGDGPVNALDAALRRSLENFYPSIKDMHLIDYKVRVVNAREGTAARVRVIIESRDKTDIWGTVGVSENIIEASWQALVDSVEYKLQKDKPIEIYPGLLRARSAGNTFCVGLLCLGRSAQPFSLSAVYRPRYRLDGHRAGGDFQRLLRRGGKGICADFLPQALRPG